MPLPPLQKTETQLPCQRARVDLLSQVDLLSSSLPSIESISPNISPRLEPRVPQPTELPVPLPVPQHQQPPNRRRQTNAESVGIGFFVTISEKCTLQSLGYSMDDIDEMDVHIAKSMCAGEQRRPTKSGPLPPSWLKSDAARLAYSSPSDSRNLRGSCNSFTFPQSNYQISFINHCILVPF